MVISTNGTAVRPPGRAQAMRPMPRMPLGSTRHRLWIFAGLALVIGFTLVFATVSLRLGGRRSVLAAARAVPAGHVLTPADLTEVRVAVDGGIRVVPATERAKVLGRPAAVALVAGSLLAPAQVGSSSALAPGQAVVGAALKAGQFPSGLAPGARVRVLDTGPAATATTGVGVGFAAASSATVVDVEAGDASGATVVSLRLSAAEADRVAVSASAGRVALVQLAEEP